MLSRAITVLAPEGDVAAAGLGDLQSASRRSRSAATRSGARRGQARRSCCAAPIRQIDAAPAAARLGSTRRRARTRPAEPKPPSGLSAKSSSSTGSSHVQSRLTRRSRAARLDDPGSVRARQGGHTNGRRTAARLERPWRSDANKRAPPARPALWRDPRVRAIAYQVLTLVGVVAFAAYIIHNTIENLDRQGIASGFGFLNKPAGFGIPQTLIDYSELSPNWRVFWVGLLNTMLVAVVGIVLATILGFVIGLARLSSNWLVARPRCTSRSSATFRCCCRSCSGTSPSCRRCRSRATAWRPVLPQQSGFLHAKPIFEAGLRLGAAGLAAVVAVIGIAHWAKRRHDATGQPFHTVYVGLGLLVGLPLLAFC